MIVAIPSGPTDTTWATVLVTGEGPFTITVMVTVVGPSATPPVGVAVA